MELRIAFIFNFVCKKLTTGLVFIFLFATFLGAQNKSGIEPPKVHLQNQILLAPDAPHWGNGIDCSSCHIPHHSQDAQLNSVNGNANLCMSCHNSAGLASDKPFSNADKADPGVSGTSHAWEVAAQNSTHGAALPSDQEMLKRIFNGNIVCSTCHDQHDQTIQPFLRASNYQDAMCKDCHSVRDVGSYRTSSSNKGSHPVGISYPSSDSRFHISPQNSNLQLIDPDRVECSTCHSPHFADSGGANGGTGDGNILRMTNDETLCEACHTYPDHQGMNCLACHQPHDPNRNNIFLVRESVSTPNSGSRSVVFTSETGTHSFADGDGNYNGICEVCHTNTNYHRNNSSGNHQHNSSTNCTDCHPHSDGFQAQVSVPPPHDAFSCETCHVTPDTYIPNAPIPNSACQTCHTQDNYQTHFSDHFVDPTTGQLMNLDCVDCHNPMSDQTNFRGNNNLKFIRSSIRGSSIAFEAYTGPYSFAYDLPDQPGDMQTQNYVCNTCHTQTNHHQNDDTAPGSQTHNDGTDCTGCHAHSDGFKFSTANHPQANTDCSNCHLEQDTQQQDLLGIHNDDCQKCHPSGFNSTIIGPIGTWNNECSECHNPNVSETGNQDIHTKGHRCVVCHTNQLSTSGIEDIHKKHIDKSNCVVCHGFIPNGGVSIGSGNRDICVECHQGGKSGSITTIHKKHSEKGLSCLECHNNSRPPIDVTPGSPVGNADHVCDICHDNKSPSEFANDSEDLHKKHGKETLDCGSCHKDATLQDDRDPMPGIDDSVRSQLNRSGNNECTHCHAGGESGSAQEVHKKHVAKQWQWCYNCHEPQDNRPKGTTPPVTNPAQSCSLCHDNKSYNDQFPFNIHKKHQDKKIGGVKCYACHQTDPNLFNWPGSWMGGQNQE